VAKETNMLTVPLDPQITDMIREVAKQEVRPVAGYIRHLIFTDLKTRGLLDENFEPTGVSVS
jgi:hypothetical protein